MLLKDDEWGQKSNYWIANQCAVSEGFVRQMRDEASTYSTQISDKRTVTRGGKTYEINTANIGKKTSQNHIDDTPQSTFEEGEQVVWEHDGEELTGWIRGVNTTEPLKYLIGFSDGKITIVAKTRKNRLQSKEKFGIGPLRPG